MTGLIASGQNQINLPFTPADHIEWKGEERAFFYKNWQTDVITNISIPSIEVYQPKKPNGTAVIIAPGGGLMANSIESEGRLVAKWLNKKGITAFVLKYRLTPTSKESVDEVDRYSKEDPVLFSQLINQVLPYSIRDAFEAILYVRQNAEKFNINTNKVGFMGFSAGGAVAMGTSYYYNNENRPDFIVNVYPWTEVMPIRFPRNDAPPMLVVCAQNDPLNLAMGANNLYNSWVNNGHKAALIMFSKGGHGFGMRKLGLASDNWINQFYDWAIDENFVIEK
ncbi:alpha/beta hydrolase [Flammeovirga kamogawensis]|uniref:Alpha/beta hydrolase n=1 Tax=Flammeovirga kamogawensis TaxID=373891 RepID=A0ABX8H2W5_9BACT|nr:alpha/beta hydrolase [Flammeovirga kamogawensis]MBB6463747.1 acetyl esterase/lipase [Flammeovirga kamogawensis]QWG09741.1 alpha/beta hydrolase [Flammeovirga kamogawensis]TRX65254.1 alpha/beta hydrolase [Flammeovirga kamogawensis]